MSKSHVSRNSDSM